jgi:speckle-type POZ protein
VQPVLSQRTDLGICRLHILFLCLDEAVTKALSVQHRFCFIDDAEEQTPSLSSESVHSFHSHRGGKLHHKGRSGEIEAYQGFKDDSFIVCCDITITNEFHIDIVISRVSPKFYNCAKI